MAGKTTKKTTSVDTKVEAVRRFFADSKPENHPIKEHPVSKQEEYVRDLYLEMLCVVAQYESSNTENAFTLIKRIMAACEETQPLEEYIKRSMELTPERAAEFVRQCKDNRLCEIFMVDSMLLSCANGEPNAKQVAFVTEFGDMLGFGKAMMERMARFAFLTLTQTCTCFQYDRAFYDGKVTDSKSKVHYLGVSEDSLYKADGVLEVSNKETVIFENMVFEGVEIRLNSVKHAVFQNCVFKKYNHGKNIFYAISGENVEQLTVTDCRFEDFELNDGAVIYMEDKCSCKLKTSHFSNIHCCRGVQLRSNSKIDIDTCDFKTIHSEQNLVVLWDGTVSVMNSDFFNCKTDYSNTLFETRNYNEKNNKFSNCAKIK